MEKLGNLSKMIGQFLFLYIYIFFSFVHRKKKRKKKPSKMLSVQYKHVCFVFHKEQKKRVPFFSLERDIK
jgi:hypothetical protein